MCKSKASKAYHPQAKNLSMTMSSSFSGPIFSNYPRIVNHGLKCLTTKFNFLRKLWRNLSNSSSLWSHIRHLKLCYKNWKVFIIEKNLPLKRTYVGKYNGSYVSCYLFKMVVETFFWFLPFFRWSQMEEKRGHSAFECCKNKVFCFRR